MAPSTNQTATPNANPSNDKPYADDEWFYSDNGQARACFTDLGEGYEGDYDETDPDDAPLYRLDVNVAAEHSDAVRGEEVDGEPEWVYPADGSICTQVVIENHGPEELIALLVYAANRIADAVTSGTTSVKGAMDSLSYLPTKR